MKRFHFSNPHFFFECSGVVWYETEHNAAGEFSRVSFHHGQIYH